MGSHLVAIGVLLTVAMTLYVIIRHRVRPFPWWRLVYGIITWAIVASIVFPLLVSPRSAPVFVCFITFFCFCLALFIPLTAFRWRLSLVCATLVMTVMLTWSSAILMSDYGYTHFSTITDRKFGYFWYNLEEIAATDERPYPPGWVADLPLQQPFTLEATRGVRIIPHAEWHSWFTALYREERQPVYAWYPGGRLRENWRKVEWRPRE